MPKYTEKIERVQLPVIPLRGLCAFPSLPINFELERDMSIAAADVASAADMMVFLVMQKDPSTEIPEPSQLFKTGCVARIKQRHVPRRRACFFKA